MGSRIEKTERTVHYCDVCGNDSSYIWKCCICRTDVCGRCSVIDEDLSDDPPRYCNKCIRVGEPFMKEIRRIEEEAATAIDVQRAKWESASAEWSAPPDEDNRTD